jgi:lipid A 4'-phosphatase
MSHNNNNTSKILVSSFIFTILTFVIFVIEPNIDIKVSSFFFKDRFIYIDTMPFDLIDKIIDILFFILFFFAIFYLVINFTFLSKTISKKILNKKKAIFLNLVYFAIMFFVYVIFKDIWQRPRPFEITNFGGVKTFQTIYEFGKGEGSSFISGHTSRAFFLLAFVIAFIKSKKLYIFSLILPLIAAFSRLVQGKHFLSDVAFSFFFCLFIIYLLKLLILENATKTYSRSKKS